MHTIYLDHATTTPIAASVREAMLPFLQNMYGHPSSNHWMGRVAAEAIEDARSCLSGLLDCHPTELIFTSGGTESANLGLLGAGRALAAGLDYRPHLITTNLEHPAVHAAVAQLQREGWDASFVACDNCGLVQPNDIQAEIRQTTRLISVTHASYEIGTIQDLSAIAGLCQGKEIVFHTDAAQTVGKIEVSLQELGVDLLSLSGHKFYGPKGVGALYVRMGVPIDSILFGEPCELGLRPGTPSVSQIAGLGQAAKLAQAGLSSSIDRVADLRSQLLDDLQRLIKLPLVAHGQNAQRVPGILSIELPNVNSEELSLRLPEICFGPSVPWQVKLSETNPCLWTCLGLNPKQRESTVRISIGWSTSSDELTQAAQMIAAAYESLSS